MLQRIAAIVFGAILAGSLLFGGTMHALVSHEHTNHHEAGESTAWQSLHASLRHDDKKALPVFNLLTVVGIVLIVLSANIPANRRIHVDTITNALRRGILPHRKFG